MMITQVESLWVLALASKCESLSIFNTIAIAFLSLLSFILINLIFWSHLGGPAWGAHKYWRRTSASAPPIPGPRGLPVIGSMDLMRGLAHHKIAAAAASCGGRRLMAFSLGQTRAVVTCDAAVAREILNGGAFSDRPANETAYNLMFSRSIGFAPYGAYWTALRKVAAAHLFCPSQVRASERQRLRIADQFVAAFGGGGDRIRVRDVLKRASLSNMMCSVFGREFDVAADAAAGTAAEAAELQDMVEQGYHLLGMLNWSDHLSFLAEFDLQKIRFSCSRLVPRVNRFVGRIIAQRRETGGGGGDFLDVLLSLHTLSDSDMIAILWEMIFRGTDTVAVLIEWILARLVLHPEVQSKVHDELDKVVGRSRDVNESDLTELVYLTSVVKEVLRLHPPGPLLSWSRLSIRDSVVDGYHVPAGTTTMVNMWAIMRDPEVWHNPLDFNPDRFLSSNASTDISIFGSDLRIAPFGSGRRSCPGKALGMTTVNFWVTKLLHEFQLTKSCCQGVDLSEVLRLSCEMADPLLVKLQPRRGVSCSKY